MDSPSGEALLGAARRRPAPLAFLVALALYAWTMAPGLVWGDSASLAVNVHRLDLSFGTAGDHPLFVLLGRVFARLPGDLTTNLNFLSAVCGALTVAVVFDIARRLGGSAWCGAIAAAALAVSHAFWLHSLIAEVYTLNALFLALTIRLLLEWRARGAGVWLALAAAVFALGLANHLVLAAFAPAAIAYVLATKPELVRRRRVVAAAAAAVVVTVLALQHPAIAESVKRLWYGPPPIYHYFLNRTDAWQLPREIGFYLLYLAYQFPLLGLALGIRGGYALVRARPAEALLLLAAMAVNALVFIKTTEFVSPGTSKYTFYIADYVVFSILVGCGVSTLGAPVNAAGGRLPVNRMAAVFAAVIALPVATYALVPWLAARAQVDLTRARKLPFRDNDAFFLQPSKRREDGARRFADEAARVIGPGGVVVADYTPMAVLRYVQIVEGRLPDTVMVASTVRGRPRDLGALARSYLPNRRVYLAALDTRYYNRTSLENEFELVPGGPFYEVVPKASPASVVESQPDCQRFERRP
jgi:hypothetical protein